jgi:hypothetical protein
LGGFRDGATKAQYEADERIINGAAAMYNAEYQVWPSSVDQLGAYLDAEILSKYSGKTIDGEGRVTLP